MVAGRELATKAAALLCFIACAQPYASAKAPDGALRRVPKQIHNKASIINSDEDHKGAETGFGGASIGINGKFFQYAHNPEHDQYEHGHRRGNDHHFQERYEKAATHDGIFKTKVRWGDKHGGYGEHYYDYNHGGHDGGDDDGGDGHHSEPVPVYNQAPGYKVAASPTEQVSVYKNAPVYKDAVISAAPYFSQSPGYKTKRHLEQVADDEAEAVAAESARVYAQDVARIVKRNPAAADEDVPSPKLVFDLSSGQVIDEVTGKAYALYPIN